MARRTAAMVLGKESRRQQTAKAKLHQGFH
jgi:hypothetical protein